jgi:thioredoxin reductase
VRHRTEEARRPGRSDRQGLRGELAYHYPNNMVFFTTPELLEIGDIPMTSLNDKPVRAEALKYYRRVADHYKLDIRQYERVEGIKGEDGAFSTYAVDAHGCPRTYESKKVILSMGYYDVPNRLNVPGEDLPKVIHYYKEAHPYYNHDVLVVGARISRHRGSRIVVDRSPRYAYSSRRSDPSERQILDQAQHRKPHQERRDPRALSFHRARDR